MKIGVVYTLLRTEEKLIIEELEKAGHEVIKINDTRQFIELNQKKTFPVDIVLMRSMSLQRSLWFAKYFESIGIKVVNNYEIINTCGNKYLTTLKLIENDIPTPKVIIAFDNNSALQGMADIGYPCVIKPLVGSWGRLIAKVPDSDTAEALIEHKMMLEGSAAFYIQEYIPKNNYDIRVMVIGNKVVGAIKRTSLKWRTNTQLGAEPEHFKVTKEMEDIALKTAQIIGKGIVSIDMFEYQGKYLVNEVNATSEFRKSLNAYQVNVPKIIADYVIKEAET
ncbi:lysine biosynthesis protein LysX [Candidatus Woesearchaeota archaeon CG10_big_fil_rev_8_21_14_0_10_34_8]|nr:MAG: lysine biosynthesis protein LysX [Candidatus Woesearchaeota archaeon CG10_big_fil_rev_8_21_14_0_10_34_8]